MKIYLAGPMRGYPDWGFPAFDRAEERWRAAGHTVLAPTAIDRALGIGPGIDQEAFDGFNRLAIRLDLAFILEVDALALLSGWEKSRGSAVELALAQFLGLPIYDAETMKPINPPLCPWQTVFVHTSPEDAVNFRLDLDAYTVCGLARARKEQTDGVQGTQRQRAVSDPSEGCTHGYDPDFEVQ